MTKDDVKIGCQNVTQMIDLFHRTALDALEEGNIDGAKYAVAFASGLDLALAMIASQYSEKDIKGRLERANKIIDRLARNSQLGPTTQAHSE